MKIAVFTLGCKVNQYESQVLINEFEKKGFEITSFDDISDVYIINTCSVTGVSDKKSRQMIKRAIKLNPDALICVTGCYAQVSKEEIEKIEGVDIITGTKDRMSLVSLVIDNIGKKGRKVNVGDVFSDNEFEPMKLDTTTTRTRISIKIQDGCENFCSYCIIPYARGPIRSKKFEEIKVELCDIINKGYREIVLTGIHISSYGQDTKTHSLLDVLKMADSLDGDFRIRLGSLNLSCFTQEFIKEIAKLKKLCPHFHISLQSGSPQTLARMNRKYTPDEFLNILNDIRNNIDNVAITTDVIVGFPGETWEEFSESMEFVRSAKFSYVHIFPYSIRKGTAASSMPNQVDKATKEQRARLMHDVMTENQVEFLQKQFGKIMPVLFEECVGDDLYDGFTPNYQKVIVKSEVDLKRQVKDVLIKDIKADELVGILI